MALGFVTGCSLPSASPPERARSGLSGILHLLLASLERRGQSESWKRAAACQRDTSLGEQPCRVVPVIVSVVFVGRVSLHQAFLPPGPPPPPVPSFVPLSRVSCCPCPTATGFNTAFNHCQWGSRFNIITAKHTVTNNLRLSFQDRGNRFPLEIKVDA